RSRGRVLDIVSARRSVLSEKPRSTTPCGIEGFALGRGWAICAARSFQKYGARRQLILEKWCRAPKALASKGLQGSSRGFKRLQGSSRVSKVPPVSGPQCTLGRANRKRSPCLAQRR